MIETATTLACAGCGTPAGTDDPYPFRCPQAGRGDDIDHVMTRRLGAGAAWPAATDESPFLRFRTLLHSYHRALAGGLSDGDYVEIAGRLDAAVAEVDGHGFLATPFQRSEELSHALGLTDGGVWVKDETGNVSGSHKARHLMGVALHLDVAARLGLGGGRPEPPLVIASCGNAALAAAVVAKAAARKLQVLVPTDAEAAVLEMLERLGAQVTVCPRQAGVPGDPTFHRMQAAIQEGALAFTCQGTENGLAIEGGQTLAWEVAAAGGAVLDRVVLQVGGGALASAVGQGFAEAAALGALARSPRIDTVQTRSAHPLERAYEKLRTRIQAGEPAEAALRYAATHRSEFMWPWETVPHSVAHGILDDETYDWLGVARGMLATGGTSVVVGEDLLEEANALGRKATGIDVDHTGSSGLAGLIALVRAGQVGPHERVAVLFTGVRR